MTPGLAQRAWSRLRATGPRGTLRHLRHLVSERYHEARLGIATAGPLRTSAVLERPGICKPYAPIAYRAFFAVIRDLRVRPDEDVFVDYGAGRGRAMVLAAHRPFRRVCGVEIDPTLVREARANFARVSGRLACRDLDLVHADALAFPCPDDATVVHFFDPFAGPLLEAILETIRESLDRHPRRITILFADPNHFDPLARACGWLARVREVPYPYRRGTEAIRESYYVYENRR